MTDNHIRDLLIAEQELALYRAGQIDMELDLDDQLTEGAYTGSMGGHDPDFEKLKNGLATWWREKAATDPHPFAYCVRHLTKKFGTSVNRLCAWLKDQSLGTTKWRNKGSQEAETEEVTWEPSRADLITLTQAFAMDNPDDPEMVELCGLADSMEAADRDEETPDPEAGAAGDLEPDGEGAGTGEAEGGDPEARPEGSEAEGTDDGTGDGSGSTGD